MFHAAVVLSEKFIGKGVRGIKGHKGEWKGIEGHKGFKGEWKGL